MPRAAAVKLSHVARTRPKALTLAAPRDAGQRDPLAVHHRHKGGSAPARSARQSCWRSHRCSNWGSAARCRPPAARHLHHNTQHTTPPPGRQARDKRRHSLGRERHALGPVVCARRQSACRPWVALMPRGEAPMGAKGSTHVTRRLPCYPPLPHDSFSMNDRWGCPPSCRRSAKHMRNEEEGPCKPLLDLASMARRRK